MRRFILFVSIISLALTSIAQIQDYCIKVGEFNEMTIANGINVVYRSNPDSTGLALFSCLPESVSAITFSNDKAKLKIQLLADKPLETVPTVTVYSLALVKVNNWGDSTITIERNNPGVEFKATVIGNGNIVANDINSTRIEGAVEAGQGHVFLSGNAQSAKYTIMSAGAIEAGHVKANNVKCVMVGTGSVDCNATESLSIVGAGSGTVYYIGEPSVKKRSIGVKVVKVGE